MANSLWDRVGATLAQEFSDAADAEQITRIVLRLAIAGVLGGVLGFEREASGKAAGVRTHMLVCMGAAAFVLVSQQAGMAQTDVSRVVQGVVAGIGFLGAGTILKSTREDSVKGLTTAAGIWLTAAVGVAAGMGRETTAVLCALLALGVLSAVPLVHRLLGRGHG
ncbi:MAG: MgtC/SapB family protein [Burkholderiaceae bacterium]